MRLFSSMALAAAVFAGPAAAQTGDLAARQIEAFAGFCVATRADNASALAAADAAGWTAAPEAFYPNQGGRLANAQRRMIADGDALLILVVGEIALASGRDDPDFGPGCTILAMPTAPGITDRFRAWSPAPVIREDPSGMLISVLYEDGAALRPLTGSDPADAERLASGRVDMLLVNPDPRGSALLYMSAPQ